MSLPLAILFESVLHRDGLVHQVLIVQRLQGGIGRVKVVVRDETVSLGFPRLWVSCDLSDVT